MNLFELKKTSQEKSMFTNLCLTFTQKSMQHTSTFIPNKQRKG